MGLLTGYQYLPFVAIQWLLALLVVVATRRRGFSSLGRSLAWGILCGLCCGAASAVISYQLFRGGTGGGVAWVTAAVRAAGYPLPVAVAIGSGTTDVLDKGHRDRGRRRTAAGASPPATRPFSAGCPRHRAMTLAARAHPFTPGAVALALGALALVLPSPGQTTALYVFTVALALATGTGRGVRGGLVAVLADLGSAVRAAGRVRRRTSRRGTLGWHSFPIRFAVGLVARHPPGGHRDRVARVRQQLRSASIPAGRHRPPLAVRRRVSAGRNAGRGRPPWRAGAAAARGPAHARRPGDRIAVGARPGIARHWCSRCCSCH